eukprot:TRINITY_DN15947_c0_g1_i1.p1 TRINITY_DN15947_c0_g1~~TRINITY_DN15947_c0_g1_i1.p1  ORF type:complete len:753 (+),score=122.92 TRINITY_DN15947_c0_g1_i1:336-2594(+)
MASQTFLLVKRQRLVAVAVICGGFASYCQMRLRLKGIQKEQMRLSDWLAATGPGDKAGKDKEKRGKAGAVEDKNRPKKVSVDHVFAGRLKEILSICTPSLFSREAFFIAVQSALLVSRTLLTDRIAALEGVAGQSVVSRNWPLFQDTLWNFAGTAVPAAFVNSGLKYMQVVISLAFRQRITEHLHQRYLTNRVYYVASTLGGLSNADQRITEDVEKFSAAISELFSYTFKPILDIILFTHSLANTVGYQGQLLLYAYFIVISGVLRGISPPLALMTAQEGALSGNFRNAQQRLVAHAEEVAFNDPPAGETEKMILNDHLYRLLRHARLSAFQRFIQQVADGYMVKYAASVIGLLVYAAPIYFNKNPGNTSTLTGEYIRAMRLMMSTSSAIGQLVLVYKRVNTLAGHTSRVAELLETVRQLSTKEGQKKAKIMKPLLLDQDSSINGHQEGAEEAEELPPPLPPTHLYSDIIRFERVTIQSPDGSVLVRELSFEVRQGQSVILMGPNGSGKSSLFRVLAELWPLQSGCIWRPPRGDIFYLSQRPYVVPGTLRDQVRYPLPPQKIAQASAHRRSLCAKPTSGADSASGPRKSKSSLSLASYMGISARPDEGSGKARPAESVEEDRRVEEALEATGIAYLMERGMGLDQHQNWEETLSGGERQRLAIARVLFHRPIYAVLDECTSAVSADGEDHLYRALQAAGITLLSIAHRPALKRYHKFVLAFDGERMGQGWSYEALPSDEAADMAPLLPSSAT